jgi:hypothetical protein
LAGSFRELPYCVYTAFIIAADARKTEFVLCKLSGIRLTGGSNRNIRRRKSMVRYLLTRSHLAVLMVVLAAGVATAQNDDATYSARLSGFNEIGPINNNSGAILTDGTGRLQLEVSPNSVAYTLTYSNLTSNALQSHIHFGKKHDAGGIMVFLCSNLGNGPAGTPACPVSGGTVTGTLTAASVVAIPTQNVTAGNFTALLAALHSDAAYVNVHTANFPGGEIRGQVRSDDRGH